MLQQSSSLQTISGDSHLILERYAPIGVLHLSETNLETVLDVAHTQVVSTWLKTILSEAVLCTIRYNERMRAYFFRLLSEGKHRNIALNNTKNKLLKTLVAMVRDGNQSMMRLMFRVHQNSRYRKYIF